MHAFDYICFLFFFLGMNTSECFLCDGIMENEEYDNLDQLLGHM